MFTWLAVWFTFGISGLSALAGKVQQALQKIVDLFTSAFTRWLGACVNLAHAIVNFYYALWTFLVVLSRIWGRIFLVAIPKAVATGLSQAVTYADSVVGQLASWVRAQLTSLTAWAQAQLSQLWSWGIGQVASLWHQLGQAVDLLTAVAGRVFALLTDPRALADWVAGQIVQAVVRWARGNAEALARMALRNAVSATYASADLIEQIIVDLFL